MLHALGAHPSARLRKLTQTHGSSSRCLVPVPDVHPKPRTLSPQDFRTFGVWKHGVPSGPLRASARGAGRLESLELANLRP